MKQIQIVIDGPSSAGKSTVAKKVARHFNYLYLDTGAMYRGVTLAILQQKISPSDAKKIEEILPTIELSFNNNANGEPELFLNGYNVSEEIRSKEVTANVSEVSAYDFVRHELVKQQREIASTQSIVMDGRDIGTVVLPDADVKVFLTADTKVRALRRYQENISKGYNQQSLAQIEQAILARDKYDTQRTISPLRQADDAILIDSSHLNVDEVTDKIIDIVKQHLFCA